VLAVRDDELDVGDDEVASSEVAEGGTAREGQGKSRGWAWGTTPVDGCRNGPRGGTGRDRTGRDRTGLPNAGNNWT
jgi:hypothetical protein